MVNVLPLHAPLMSGTLVGERRRRAEDQRRGGEAGGLQTNLHRTSPLLVPELRFARRKRRDAEALPRRVKFMRDRAPTSRPRSPASVLPYVSAYNPVYFDGKQMVKTGQELIIRNNTAMAQNVRAIGDGKKNDGFNRNLPPMTELNITTDKSIKLVPQLMPLSILSDIDRAMSARLYVFDHPYYAMTKADGTFEIPFVPAGAEIRPDGSSWRSRLAADEARRVQSGPAYHAQTRRKDHHQPHNRFTCEVRRTESRKPEKRKPEREHSTRTLFRVFAFRAFVILFPQRPRNRTRIIGGTNGLADGDAAGADGENLGDVVELDAADGECRQRRFRTGFPHECQSREGVEGFRLDGKVGPTPR